MAVFTIAGLTLKEAVRRRTLLGVLLMGLLILGLSLLFMAIRSRMQHSVDIGRLSAREMATRLPYVRSVITLLCLSAVKYLGALFGILLAGGSISSEIERGLLAVILPKPIPRWQILLGKWLGVNLILVGSVLVWTALAWASLTLQTHMNLTALLHAGLYLSLFPVLISTLTLSLSTFAQRMFGTALALTVCALAWFDGILNALDQTFNTDWLRIPANIAAVILPQGTIGWWVERTTENIMILPPRFGIGGESPRWLLLWGEKHLHIAHLDAVYVAVYVVVALAAGMIVFQQRDV